MKKPAFEFGKLLDVSGAPGIAEVVECDYPLGTEPLGKPTKEFKVPDAEALKITLDNGAVFLISTSEWATVDYFAPPEKPPCT